MNRCVQCGKVSRAASAGVSSGQAFACQGCVVRMHIMRTPVPRRRTARQVLPDSPWLGGAIAAVAIGGPDA